VDGAQGRFLQITGALVSWQHVAADESCSRRVLFCRSRRLGATGDMSARICRRAFHRDAADPPASRTAELRNEGGSAMRLSPDEMVFGNTGLSNWNGTIVFTWGLMLVLAVGSKTHHAQSFHGAETFPLAEPLEIIVTGIENKFQTSD